MVDKKVLDILACPICKGKLIYQSKENRLICKVDHLAYPIQNGIPIMLEAEAETVSQQELDSV